MGYSQVLETPSGGFAQAHAATRGRMRGALALFMATLCMLAALVGTAVAPPQAAYAGESTTGTGSDVIYYNIQENTNTSLSVGDTLYISSTDMSDSTYASTTFPFSAELNVTAVGSVTAYGYTYDYTVSVVTAATGFDKCTTGYIRHDSDGWRYGCSGSGVKNIGPYKAYTVSQKSISASDITVTDKSVPDSGTVTSDDIAVQITIDGTTYTLDSDEYSFTDSALDAANGDCTYTVKVGDMTITRFDPSHANSVIDNNPNLTDADKTNLKTQLQGATEDSDVSSILKDATALADQNLENAKTNNKTDLGMQADKYKADIDALSNLTDEQKTAFKEQIESAMTTGENAMDKASTLAGVTEAYNTAISSFEKTLAAAKLQDAKNEATQDILDQYVQDVAAIVDLDNLSDADKQSYSDELEKAKDTALEAIENATTEDEVQAAKDAYKEASDLIIKKATAENDVVKAAADATDAVDALENLSDAEKAAIADELAELAQQAKEAIAKATTPEEAEKIAAEYAAQAELVVDKAKGMDAINAKTAETEAAIDALDSLTDAEKQALKDELQEKAAAAKENIEDATSADGVDSIVNDFDNTADGVLDEAIAQNHVNEYLLDEDGDFIDEFDSGNLDKVLAGKDAYDQLTDAQKALVDEKIAAMTDGKYSSYEEYAQAAQDAIDASAQSFIDKYLSDSNGNIYTKATRDNYAQILSGQDAWNALSQAEKDAINAKLVANGGKTYEELLASAQDIQKQVEAEKAAKAKKSSTGKTGDVLGMAVPIALAVALAAAAAGGYALSRRPRGKHIQR